MTDRTPEPTGAELRDQGIAAVLDADRAIHKDHRPAVEAVLRDLIAAGREFTADDLRARLPQDVQDRLHENLLGAVISESRRAGHLRQVGWETSSRPSRHGGALRVWVPVTVEAEAEAA